ncbi:F-box only protein 44-like [Stegastes partitus]|uniref:F-box only protein 44-like n=1 Tax=Stegastes partitus TaxID=144197 RepID=A0A3B5ALN1_9TELE|nr:PREDICTED: F-box only protein 44-like [Stegastes partitus]
MKRKAMDKSHSSDHDRERPTRRTAQEPLFSAYILEEIFLKLPPQQVVVLCRVVCHQWKEVADSESFWRQRCRREGYHPSCASKIPSDWRKFYFLCIERRNLLRNPRGEQGLNGWRILKNGGDRWAVHGIRKSLPDDSIQSNFVTSFGMCTKMQLIDLENEGYSSSFMDDFQPDIRIYEWYTRCPDCSCMYNISVELLNERKQLIQKFAPDTVYPEVDEWKQMTHIFQNYGPGVRYIRFTHGGKDTRFWKGWYGIRLTESCVEICPAKDT